MLYEIDEVFNPYFIYILFQAILFSTKYQYTYIEVYGKEILRHRKTNKIFAALCK